MAVYIDDEAFKDCWFARLHLFFKCYLRLKGGRGPKNNSYKVGQVYTHIYLYIHVYLRMNVFNNFLPDDLLRELVFFNTFQELKLPIKGPIEDAEVVEL